MVEDDFYLPFSTRRPGCGDGLPVVIQPEVRAYECLQPYLRGDAECELEAARLFSIVLLDAIGVASGESDFFVPEGGQVECALRAGHADERDLATRARQAERILHGAWRADTLEDLAGSAHHDRLAELGFVGRRAQHLGEFRVGLFGVDYLGRSKTNRLVPLSLVFGDADDVACIGKVSQGRDGKEADAAGPDDQGRVARGEGGPECGVDGAGEGLDGDGGFVGYCVWYAVELRGVGDERALRPAT